VTRLTAKWQDDAAGFGKRSLGGSDYVYLWVDGWRTPARDPHLSWHMGNGRGWQRCTRRSRPSTDNGALRLDTRAGPFAGSTRMSYLVTHILAAKDLPFLLPQPARPVINILSRNI
jgi:hypothetical protein